MSGVWRTRELIGNGRRRRQIGQRVALIAWREQLGFFPPFSKMLSLLPDLIV